MSSNSTVTTLSSLAFAEREIKWVIRLLESGRAFLIGRDDFLCFSVSTVSSGVNITGKGFLSWRSVAGVSVRVSSGSLVHLR